MSKCLLCNKDGNKSNELRISASLCDEHYKTIKELEDNNKRHYERIARKIRRVKESNQRS